MSSSHRKLAAILFSDLEGFSHLMGNDESGAMKMLRQCIDIHKDCIKLCNGKLLKQMGDGILAEFDSAYEAVSCAIQIQNRLKSSMIYIARIGIHLGDVYVEENDIFGDGVNIASRIQSVADPGGIYVSDAIRNATRSRSELSFGLIGKVKLKNIEDFQTLYYVKGHDLPVPENSKINKLTSGPTRNIYKVVFTFATIISIAAFIFIGTKKNKIDSISKQVSSVAVLPFFNTKEMSDVDYLSFAMADQVISSISYLKEIAVRPSSAVWDYQGRKVDPVRAGKDLDVDYVLAGSYLKENNILRVNVELISVEDNHIIWGEAIEVDFKSVFDLQDIVTQKIIEGLKLRLTKNELKRLRKDVPSSPLAYEYYLKGVSYQRNNEGNRLAVAMFSKSIEIDSTFAPTHAQLGKRLHELATFGMKDEETTTRAEKSLLKALSINDEQVRALGYLSMLYTERNQIEKAVATIRKIIEISPNDAVAHFSLGYIYRYAGMMSQAVEEMEKALALDSRNEDFRSILITYIAAGYYEQVIEAGNRFSSIPANRARIGHAYFLKGDFENARHQFEQILNIEPEGLHALTAICLTAIMDNNPELGLEAARRFENAGVVDAEAWFYFGCFYCALGDIKSGMRALERAVEGGYFNYPQFVSYPLLKKIQTNHEFSAIIHKAKLKHEAFMNKFF